MFFKEGDELSQLAPDENDLDEVTEMVPCPKSRRRLAVFIAAAAVAMVGLAVLVL